MSTSAPPIPAAETRAPTRDPLELFGGILDPHLVALEDRAAALSESMPSHDPDWIREQRAQLGAPFDRLGRLLDRWNSAQLEHASRRVATASFLARARAHGDRGATEQVQQAGRARAEEMLGQYERMIGGDWAQKILQRARALYGFVEERGEAWATEQAAGELKAWFVPRAKLDQAVASWFEQHGEAAARDIALRRAEHEITRSQPQPAVEIVAPRAPETDSPEQARTDDARSGRYRQFLGRELAEHLDARAEALAAECEPRSTEELRSEQHAVGARLDDVYAAAQAKAAVLNAERNGLLNSINESRSQAASLDAAAKELRSEHDRTEQRAKAADLRRDADNARKALRRRDGALDKLRQEWFGEHGEDAALAQALSRQLQERAQDRVADVEQPTADRAQPVAPTQEATSFHASLDRNGYLLGQRRAAEITAGARFLGEQLNDASPSELQARLGELGEPFATLDKTEALATLARERERRMILGDLQARLAGVEAGNTDDRRWIEYHQAQLAEHDQAEAQRARSDPHHPEAWMRGPDAAALQEGLAIEGALREQGMELPSEPRTTAAVAEKPARALAGAGQELGTGR